MWEFNSYPILFLIFDEYGFTCLLYAMDQMSEYCLALNETFVDTSKLVRQEKKLFDEDAFREAWINAIVHNKWIDGIPPAVYWYDDRLEIVSYGTIPNGMTKEDFLSGKTHPVNEELMKIFLQCHIVEQTGHGVPKVVNKYGAKAYDFGTSMITVTIPIDKSGFENEPQNEPQKNISNIIKEKIKKNPKITKIKLAEECNVSLSTIKRVLKENNIIFIGASKSGHWEIKK